jgi:hypothetical protein
MEVNLSPDLETKLARIASVGVAMLKPWPATRSNALKMSVITGAPLPRAASAGTRDRAANVSAQVAN